jgi:DNA mismatch repair protein MLH1
LLEDKREMLDEYFSLSITDDGKVEALPMLLRGYTPNLDRLPHFMLCLGAQVDWDTEKECFQAFLHELAFFYSPRPFAHAPSLEVPTETEGEVDPAATTQEEIDHRLWQLEHVLFPSFQKHTTWPGDFLGREVSQLASLPDLFKVFERC